MGSWVTPHMGVKGAREYEARVLDEAMKSCLIFNHVGKRAAILPTSKNSRPRRFNACEDHARGMRGRPGPVDHRPSRFTRPDV